MKDINGIEIKTGQIVEISGAFFKNDNGFYFVNNSPGDPAWCGRDYSLKKISKKGKVSVAKHNICFWPISVYVSDREKRAAANEWNRENAKIEVKSVPDMSEVAAHFEDRASDCERARERMTWDFGEDCETVKKYAGYRDFYLSVAAAIRKGA